MTVSVVEENLTKYLAFFRQVLPDGLVAIHAPYDSSQNPPCGPRREEIRLQTYSGKIFVTGCTYIAQDTIT